MKKDLISIVTPVYGDRRNVKLLYESLVEQLSILDVDYEILMVNDFCPYHSGEEIEQLALNDYRVKFIDLSRNFGQHYAIKAGLDYSKGDYVVVMDCDLQDKPSDIPRFYKKIKEGYDVVWGIRAKRKDNLIKKLFSKVYSFIERHFANFTTEYDHGNFSIISRKVAEKFKNINNYNFNYTTIINYLGFQPTAIEIEKDERGAGTSCYDFLKGIKLALKSLISNSNKPLIFAAYCSLLMFVLSLLLVLKLLIDYFFISETKLLGWTSLMSSIFFIGGLLFAYLSILGLYIGGIFQEVKQRPLYIVRRTINIEK